MVAVVIQIGFLSVEFTYEVLATLHTTHSPWRHSLKAVLEALFYF